MLRAELDVGLCGGLLMTVRDNTACVLQVGVGFRVKLPPSLPTAYYLHYVWITGIPYSEYPVAMKVCEGKR